MTETGFGGRPGGVGTRACPRWGPLGKDRFWLELPDGRLFTVDEETCRVVEDLCRGLSPERIAQARDVEEEDVWVVAQLVGWSPPAGGADEPVAGGPETGQPPGTPPPGAASGPGVTSGVGPGPATARRWQGWWFVLCLAGPLALSTAVQIHFAATIPLLWVTGLGDLWGVAGALTIGLVLHETGHWLATPRVIPGRVRLTWFGPIPMLSLVNTELWKWPRWRRIVVDVAGAVMDLMVGGVAAAIGLLRPELAPFVWSFLFVHWIRMTLALLPLFPGDGYFLLVDVLGRPNLWQESVRALRSRRWHWLSLYALMRLALQGLSWLWFWGWMVSIARLWWMRTVYGGQWSLWLHPAAIFIVLSATAQLFGGVQWAVQVMRLRGWRTLFPGRLPGSLSGGSTPLRSAGPGSDEGEGGEPRVSP